MKECSAQEGWNERMLNQYAATGILVGSLAVHCGVQPLKNSCQYIVRTLFALAVSRSRRTVALHQFLSAARLVLSTVCLRSRLMALRVVGSMWRHCAAR